MAVKTCHICLCSALQDQSHGRCGMGAGCDNAEHGMLCPGKEGKVVCIVSTLCSSPDGSSGTKEHLLSISPAIMESRGLMPGMLVQGPGR